MLTKPTLIEKIITHLSQTTLHITHLPPRTYSDLDYWLNKGPARALQRENAQERKRDKRVKEALRRLQKTNLISYLQPTQTYQLTPKGWLKYMYYNAFKTPKKKTKKFKSTYLVIFDIPEEFKRFRDLFRKCLQNQGCRTVQKSVFACPNKQVYFWAKKVVYNCELEGHVLFIEADTVSQ